jgi:RND family efflux transporter MFP subunit
MAAWKQIVLSLVVLVAAALGWAFFFPGAQDVLNRWGVDWAHASTPRAGVQSAKADSGGGGRLTVVAEPVKTAIVNDRLQAIGTGRAKATVTVTPYSSGRLTEFLIGSGAHVKAGQIIAKLDSDVERIALDRAVAARDDARAKVERLRKLRASNAATNVQLSDAELELRNAELTVHDAQVTLDRRSIVSPISGIVGILPIEAGNYVTTTSSIATIDDRSSILVDFWVPERFAPAVAIGAELTATALASAGDVFKGTVTAVDNHIDEKSRTLWVRATIDNPADSLRAGMSFQITMKFPGDAYPAVSPLAIQWGADGAFVWAVRDGKVAQVPVRIIQRNANDVLINAPIASGDMVVTEGVQSVRDGDAVRIASDGGEQQAVDVSGS